MIKFVPPISFFLSFSRHLSSRGLFCPEPKPKLHSRTHPILCRGAGFGAASCTRLTRPRADATSLSLPSSRRYRRCRCCRRCHCGSRRRLLNKTRTAPLAQQTSHALGNRNSLLSKFAIGRSARAHAHATCSLAAASLSLSFSIFHGYSTMLSTYLRALGEWQIPDGFLLPRSRSVPPSAFHGLSQPFTVSSLASYKHLLLPESLLGYCLTAIMLPNNRSASNTRRLRPGLLRAFAGPSISCLRLFASRFAETKTRIQPRIEVWRFKIVRFKTGASRLIDTLLKYLETNRTTRRLQEKEDSIHSRNGFILKLVP